MPKCEACGQEHPVVECEAVALHEGIRGWLEAGRSVSDLLDELAAHLRDYFEDDEAEVIPEHLTKN